MSDFDKDFYESNKIVLETLDNLDEYISTIDVWVKMHEDSEKDIVGNEAFGIYTLHVFDSPVEIVTSEGEVLDTFQAAISVEKSGDLATRETFTLVFPTEQEARAQLAEVASKFEDFWVSEWAAEEDLEELEG